MTEILKGEPVNDFGAPPANQSPPLPALAENTAEKQRGRPFEPGKSGNPNGRPKGSRNKSTLLAEALLDGESETIVRKLIEKAKEGDPGALRLCMERLLPPRRDRVVTFDLEDISSAKGATAASSAVLKACADGALSPDEASKIMNMIIAHTQTLALTDLETQLRDLENELLGK